MLLPLHHHELRSTLSYYISHPRQPGSQHSGMAPYAETLAGKDDISLTSAERQHGWPDQAIQVSV